MTKSHRSRVIIPLVLACATVACGDQESSVDTGENTSSLVDIAQTALDVAHDSAEALYETVTSNILPKLAARLAEAGMVAAAAPPYVYARECGASDAQLRAYKQMVRARFENQPTFSEAEFQADFEAGVRLTVQQIRVNGSPLYDAQQSGLCQWALDVVASM